MQQFLICVHLGLSAYIGVLFPAQREAQERVIGDAAGNHFEEYT